MACGILSSRASGGSDSEASIAGVVIVVMLVGLRSGPAAGGRARNLARVPEPGRGPHGNETFVAAERQPAFYGRLRAGGGVVGGGPEGGGLLDARAGGRLERATGV